MQKDDKIIESVIRMIKNRDLSYRIKSSLKSQGINDTDIDLYLEKAKAKILERNLNKLPLQNKTIYYSTIALAVITFIIVLVIVFKYSSTGNGVFTSVIGAFLVGLFSWFAIMYHKSWEETYIRERGSVDFNFKNFGFLFIPIMILFFIFYQMYGSVQEGIIRDSMVQTIATITDGYSVGAKRSQYGQEKVDHYTVTVSFFTDEGKKVLATKSTRYNDHDLFFIGQEIPITYSSIDPKIIELLVNDRDTRRVTGSEERRLRIKDLVSFMNSEEKDTIKMLNRIRYGWDKNDANTYVNLKMNLFISFSDNTIAYVDAGKIAQMPGSAIYRNDLLSLGFKRIKEESEEPVSSLFPKSTRYESEEYTLLLEHIYEKPIRAIKVTLFKK